MKNVKIPRNSADKIRIPR